MNHERLVAYVRVSTDDKDQDPERQRPVLARWAESHGVEITEWIIDEGTSARKVSPLDRTKVQQAIRAANKTGATGILVENLDRWCRTGNRDLVVTDVRLQERYGLEVVMIDLPDGLEGLAWEVIRTIKAEYAREFSDELGNRIRQGLELAKTKGWPKGKPGPKPKHPLTPTEVLQVQAWRDAGMGWRAVAHRLSEARGAFDVADRKLQRRRAVSDAWVRKSLIMRAQSGDDCARQLTQDMTWMRTNVVDSARAEVSDA